MVWSGKTNCHNWKNYCQTPGESLLVKLQGRLGGERLYFGQIVFGGFAVKVSNQGRLYEIRDEKILYILYLII
jgi:hypothetical protein